MMCNPPSPAHTPPARANFFQKPLSPRCRASGIVPVRGFPLAEVALSTFFSRLSGRSNQISPPNAPPRRPPPPDPFLFPPPPSPF